MAARASREEEDEEDEDEEEGELLLLLLDEDDDDDILVDCARQLRGRRSEGPCLLGGAFSRKR